MDAFHSTFAAHEVIFGAGALDQLPAALERARWRRVLLCATARTRASARVGALEAALGEWLVARYEGITPHVPEGRVEEALALARAHEVDAVIGLGGGSAIGIAKAVCHALAEPGDARQSRAGAQAGREGAAVIAVPTTYAGSEMTPVFGVTHQREGTARKVTVSDARITPRLVIYDPLLTLDLPPALTAGTGINAVAHCIEALYSITRNPLSTAAALGGLRALAHAPRRCWADGGDVEARGETLAGAHLAGTALAHVAMGLHHGVCHVLGGTAGVAHGDANGVMLPHAMRFNLEATAHLLAPAAEALGVATTGQSDNEAAEAALDEIERWTAEMRMPRRLCELGIGAERLPELAEMAFTSKTVRNNPRPIKDVAEIEALLRAAW